MVCIINYGSGNVAALANVYRRERVPHLVANSPHDLRSGTHYILPGVGAFDPTMEMLERSGFRAALEEEVFGNKKPVLGICVGMHLLAEGSEEGTHPGLGWIGGYVRKIDPSRLPTPPYLPHMGWNSVQIKRSIPLLEGIDMERGFYFLHSYYFDANGSDAILATVEYGQELPCVVGKDNVFGAQFHPEKSHRNGVRLLVNFARLL